MMDEDFIAMCKENDATDTEAVVDGDVVWLYATVAGKRRRWKFER